MNWLLNLYPPAWQKRYRNEVQALLEQEPVRLRTALDLMAGAADAWLNPNLFPKETGGEKTMITSSRKGPVEVSKEEARRSAIWMLGISLLLAVAGVALDKTIGQHIMIEALLYSAFFIAFTISSRFTLLKPYSSGARNSIIVGVCVGWYGFFLGVNALTAMS